MNKPIYPWPFPADPKLSTPKATAPDAPAVDMEPQDGVQTCEKCGAQITTGAMAILCPLGKDCALRGDEDSGESIDFFREAFGVDENKETL